MSVTSFESDSAARTYRASATMLYTLHTIQLIKLLICMCPPISCIFIFIFIIIQVHHVTYASRDLYIGGMQHFNIQNNLLDGTCTRDPNMNLIIQYGLLGLVLGLGLGLGFILY